MMTIASDRTAALAMMVSSFKFIEKQAGNSGLVNKAKGGMDESRTDEVDIGDVMSSVRLIHKAFQKKEARGKKPMSDLSV